MVTPDSLDILFKEVSFPAVKARAQEHSGIGIKASTFKFCCLSTPVTVLFEYHPAHCCQGKELQQDVGIWKRMNFGVILKQGGRDEKLQAPGENKARQERRLPGPIPGMNRKETNWQTGRGPGWRSGHRQGTRCSLQWPSSLDGPSDQPRLQPSLAEPSWTEEGSN